MKQPYKFLLFFLICSVALQSSAYHLNKIKIKIKQARNQKLLIIVKGGAIIRLLSAKGRELILVVKERWSFKQNIVAVQYAVLNEWTFHYRLPIYSA